MRHVIANSQSWVYLGNLVWSCNPKASSFPLAITFSGQAQADAYANSCPVGTFPSTGWRLVPLEEGAEPNSAACEKAALKGWKFQPKEAGAITRGSRA